MSIILFAAILALAAFALEWLEYKYVIRSIPSQIYIITLVAAFTGLGIWIGHKLSHKPAPENFAVNEKALRSLKITQREYAVLECLAEGKSNKLIARDLGISPNTVKTHIANLYEKLGANGRMQAVLAARELSLLP